MVLRGMFLKLTELNQSYVSDLLPVFKRYYQRGWFIRQSASWNSRFDAEFTEILTKRGYGFAFNMLPKSKLFTDE